LKKEVQFSPLAVVLSVYDFEKKGTGGNAHFALPSTSIAHRFPSPPISPSCFSSIHQAKPRVTLTCDLHVPTALLYCV
jgi:hypothetical protein